VAYRFLQECPWQRLRDLRKAMPNVMTQMLFRGSNGVGYTNYADNAVEKFIQTAGASGVDLKEAGAHVLGLKDMGGLLKPTAAGPLVKALKEETGMPVHFHTHDTSGVSGASILEAAKAGVDAVDLAMDAFSGGTSQPCLGSTYADVNQMFGDIPKVTPSSKTVGDMALMMVSQGLTRADVEDPETDVAFPESVVNLMKGALGQPPGGWPKALQKKDHKRNYQDSKSR